MLDRVTPNCELFLFTPLKLNPQISRPPIAASIFASHCKEEPCKATGPEQRKVDYLTFYTSLQYFIVADIDHSAHGTLAPAFTAESC